MSETSHPDRPMRLQPSDPGAGRLWEQSTGRLEELARRIRSSDSSRPDPGELGLPGLVASAPVLGALDRMGRHEETAQVLKGYRSVQRWGGEFRVAGEGPASTGAGIWSLVDHARVTEDLDYLQGVYRRIRRGLRWLERTRTPDGAARFAGLMPSGTAEEGPERPLQRYRASFWAMAGAQEAARAATVLHHRGLQHEGEALFHELSRALKKALAREEGEEGSPFLGPGPGIEEPGARDPVSDILLSVVCSEVFPPDYAPLARTLEELIGPARSSLPHAAITGHQLLRRGDPRVWELVDHLASPDAPGRGEELTAVDAALLFWLLRALHLNDGRTILLLAPGYALRPLAEGGETVVEEAPSLHGPVSYRLSRRGELFQLEWAHLERHAPENFIWPLPGRVYRVEPPRISLTDSRMAIRLDPAGGRLEVELVPGTFPTL